MAEEDQATTGGHVGDRLHVGTAILDWMRDQCTRPDPGASYVDRSLGTLLGVPVFLDESLPPGAWKFMRDGEQVGSGYVGREGEVTAYLSGAGFVSFAEPELPEPPRLVMVPVGQPNLLRRAALVGPTVYDPDPRAWLRITGV